MTLDGSCIIRRCQQEVRPMAAHYWYSGLPTSKTQDTTQVGADDIGIYYLKEPVSVIGE